jgi:hypothetical protein
MGDLDKSGYGTPSSPVSSPVPFCDATQMSSSVAMSSYIWSLLEIAFTADYDQYGIPGSPTGSLASVDDHAAESEYIVSSTPSPIHIDNSVSRFVVFSSLINTRLTTVHSFGYGKEGQDPITFEQCTCFKEGSINLNCHMRHQNEGQEGNKVRKVNAWHEGGCYTVLLTLTISSGQSVLDYKGT